MKTWFFLLLTSLSVVAANAQTTTWTAAGNPHVVSGTYTVPAGQTLVMQPGVIVSIQANSTLRVDGQLVGNGTAANRIQINGGAPGSQSKLVVAGTSDCITVKSRDQSRLPEIGGRNSGGLEFASADSSLPELRRTGPGLSSVRLGRRSAISALRMRCHDPTLSLYDSNGNLLASNDGWREANQPEIATAGLAPGDDREAALFQSLEPGAYTVIVAGKDGATGVGLVEAYHLP